MPLVSRVSRDDMGGEATAMIETSTRSLDQAIGSLRTEHLDSDVARRVRREARPRPVGPDIDVDGPH